MIARDPLRVVAWAVSLGGIAWGLRVTALEGFIYSWPRGFSGDFTAIMFNTVIWDGTGIVYGPVFVLERLLVRAWPEVFTIYTFAIANIGLVAVAFVACAVACRLSPLLTVASLAAWLCTFPLAYAFSVAANPELLELALLSLAWVAVDRGRHLAAGALVAAATFTKVLPAIFAIPGLIGPGRRRFVAGGAAVAVAVGVVVGVAQRMAPLELIRAILIPSVNPAPASGIAPTTYVQRAFDAQTDVQFSSLQASIARLALSLGIDIGGDLGPFNIAVQAFTVALSAVLLATAAVITYRLRRDAPGHRSEVAVYPLFFALLPLVTFQAHPHTTVLILPVWTGLLWLLGSDPDPRRAARYGIASAAAYVWIGLALVPALIDRLLGTQVAQAILTNPIWGELALIGILYRYAWVSASRLEGRGMARTIAA